MLACIILGSVDPFSKRRIFPAVVVNRRNWGLPRLQWKAARVLAVRWFRTQGGHFLKVSHVISCKGKAMSFGIQEIVGFRVLLLVPVASLHPQRSVVYKDNNYSGLRNLNHTPSGMSDLNFCKRESFRVVID